VVTGAGGGIGRAIALVLARQGVQLCLLGRDAAKLGKTVAAVQQFTQVTAFEIDLAGELNFQALLQHLETSAGKLHVLIHSAGAIHLDLLEQASITDLDLQYATNVRAPYLMTQQLLPLLTQSRGQIVFINSSAGLTSKRPEAGQYAATKHALKAIADSLREEVNPRGIRVLSMYLGRTATPLQEALYEQQGSIYQPERLLQPEDVASTVVFALTLPATAEVTDITMRPLQKSY
jgi:NADP-dependent 3-hydroxy acid dehydrogenase YdfG